MSDDFSSSWAPGWPAAGSVVAGYRLEDRIGQGGMAVVFRAHDARLNRRVAVKLLAPALAGDAGFRQRFTGEALAAAAVDDPHIIPVFEAGEADGVLFIAMRYVGGGDVASLVRREGPLEVSRATAILSPVASALDAAHAAGLVHRDVKPANMLLDVRPGRPDHVYLSDFGLSKASLAASGLTGTGHFIGTLDYISPEQIEGRPVDGRADQYALACAAFEMLAGEPPFPRDQGLAVVAAHLSTPPPLISSRRPGLPPGVDEVFTRALAKAPSDRFSACGDFAEALRAALGLAPYDAGSASRTPTQVAAPLAGPAPAAPMPGAVTPGPGAATSGPAAATPEAAAVTSGPGATTSGPGAVAPGSADGDPPGPGAGDPPGAGTGSAPGREGAWAVTVDASRVAAQPRREPVPPASGPKPGPGYPAAGGAGPGKAPDQIKGWRPSRRAGVIAAACAALAAAAIIVAVISLRPAPTSHGSAITGHGSAITGQRSTPTAHGSTPVALVLPPSTAYVTNYLDNTVTPIDVATGSAGTPIQVGEGPDAIAITPDGKTAYVANYDGTTGVTPIDLATGSAGTQIPGRDCGAIAVTPDGKTVYFVSSYNGSDGTVTPIDVASDSEGNTIQVGNGPIAIAFTP